jgi:hypothetical protein
MSVLVALVLGLCALAFVLYPLYRRRSSGAVQAVSTTDAVAETTQPDEKEQAARSALHEVELDYQLGNISEGDYQALRERYMRRALVALKTRYEREQEIDQEIEEQLRALKESHENNHS